jgi:hypothetical protein
MGGEWNSEQRLLASTFEDLDSATGDALVSEVAVGAGEAGGRDPP